MRLGRAAAGGLAVAACAAAASGCTNPRQLLHVTVEKYLAAVQQREDEALAQLWAPYRREVAGLPRDEERKRFAVLRGRIQEGHALYERAMKEGVLPPDPLGIALFRALGLGKGAVSLPVSAAVDAGGGSARVRTRMITNLDALHLENLPDGVRVFLIGYPFGGIETITVGFDDIEEHRLLHSVDLDWRLSRAPEGSATPGGWLIESLAADPASAVEWKARAGG
jgi:hypothetical protein